MEVSVRASARLLEELTSCKPERKECIGFPEDMGNFFGVPIRLTCSILGSILGSSYLGKLPYDFHEHSNFRVRSHSFTPC